MEQGFILYLISTNPGMGGYHPPFFNPPSFSDENATSFQKEADKNKDFHRLLFKGAVERSETEDWSACIRAIRESLPRKN